MTTMSLLPSALILFLLFLQPLMAHSVRLCVGLSGPISDLGYNFMHNLGRREAVSSLQSRYPALTFDSVIADSLNSLNETEQGKVWDNFVLNKNCSIVVSNSIVPSTLAAATRHPTVQFVITTDVVRNSTRPNVKFVFGRLYQASYLAGIVAASATTKGGCIGFVASQRFSTVRLMVNALALGARTVDPNISVHVIPLDRWLWEEGAKKAAELLHLRAGCKILAYRENSMSTALYAQERIQQGVKVVGYASNVRDFVGDSVLISVMLTFDVIYERILSDYVLQEGFRWQWILFPWSRRGRMQTQ